MLILSLPAFSPLPSNTSRECNYRKPFGPLQNFCLSHQIPNELETLWGGDGQNFKGWCPTLHNKEVAGLSHPVANDLGWTAI
ncbi:hypothetical protein CEXT_385771 [Caerostris extrusa]|uniref:Uncharacterized protein n=1 Tax=Caerostris extrusa TaxID=172846 RepID=A0AAV4WD54_CAEEX|nr:hypothetical protein CEXT_385771 [Caerostris extrusa]